MKYRPEIHHRQSIRLKKYDYSQTGLYFITICTQKQLHLFGEIEKDKMQLNDAGLMVDKIWHEIPEHFTNAELQEFVIMPNHIHGIIEIAPVQAPLVTAAQSQIGQPQRVAPTIGDIVGAFKSLTTCEYIQMVKQNILPPFDKRIWQRNYWEHIIRNENEHNQITQYILDNPKKWTLDKLNVGSSPCGCP